MNNGFPDIAADLWIIREWLLEQSWSKASPAARNEMVAEVLDDEQAGYGLPDDYTSGPRLHVFAADDCEVWLGCFNPEHMPPTQCGRIALMTSKEMTEALSHDDGPFVLLLDGREVVGTYRKAAP